MQPRIPWGRLGIEGLTIVTSILLALAAQAWWEGRQQRSREAEQLAALRTELEEGLRRFPTQQQLFVNALASHEALVRQFQGGPLAPPDSLLYWMSELSWPATFDLPRSVFDDLVSSGGLQRIRDDATRIGIADNRTVLNRYLGNVDQAWIVWSERIQPYLDGRVPRVDRLLHGTYARPDRPVPFADSRFTPNYAALFNDPAFESMIAERWIRISEAARALDRLAQSMEDLLGLLD